MRAHYGFNLCGTLETQSWISFSSSLVPRTVLSKEQLDTSQSHFSSK